MSSPNQRRWLRRGANKSLRFILPNNWRKHEKSPKFRKKRERRARPLGRLRIMNAIFRGEQLSNKIARNKKRLPVVKQS